MTLKRAAWWAMAGVLLRGAYYWTANMLPSWSAEIPADFRAQLVIVSTLDPLAWAAYFAMMATDRAPKIPAMLAVVFGLAQVGLSGFRQYRTFSAMSLDTIAFFFGVLGAVCWCLVLIAQIRGVGAPRASMWYLLLFGMAEIAMTTFNIGNSYQTIWDYGREAPFVLIVSPLIWLGYWITQTQYVRQLQVAKA